MSTWVTPGELDSVMEFEHVIRVHEDGTVSDGDGYAPDIMAEVDDEGSFTADTDGRLIEQARDQGWSLETGWTGQYGYNGPAMHESEYIGGRLAEHILATPGLWVALVIYTDEDGDNNIAGWALAHKDDE